ncbi:MaoC/PaaZ C-terminal domain-containing protein, partial [Rhodococcus chondri]
MSTSATVTRVGTLGDLAALEGTHIGTSSWFAVEQDRIDTFADATGDHQWIHVDVERAAAESPFGAPIAHGSLSLSLIAPMWGEGLTVG